MIELIGGIEPARTYILAALKAGKNVVTANKDLIAVHGKEILKLPGQHRRIFCLRQQLPEESRSSAR